MITLAYFLNGSAKILPKLLVRSCSMYLVSFLVSEKTRHASHFRNKQKKIKYKLMFANRCAYSGYAYKINLDPLLRKKCFIPLHYKLFNGIHS